MHQLFICHSSKDIFRAQEIVGKFEKMKIRCWMAPRDLLPGSNHLHELPARIEACEFFLLLISKNTCLSKWVELEMLQAIDARKQIIPLVIDDTAVCDGFAFALRNTQIRRIDGNEDAVIGEIAAFVREKSYALEELMPMQYYEHARECGDLYDAAKWYRCAANRGHLLSQKKLGDCYLFGDGVPVSFEQALYWYRMAAQRGMPEAMCCLAICYDHGYGVAVNEERAAAYYRYAAESGVVFAQYCLGTMYESGEGVKQDRATAVMWYQRAAAQGDRESMEKLRQFVHTS